MPKHDAINYPVQQIREMISEGKTQEQIAEILSAQVDPRINAKLIYKVCKKHGIKCQRCGARSGPGNRHWNGGKTINKSGYIETWMPEHHSCVRKTARRRKGKTHYVHPQMYVLEHRLVMEKKLGRELLDTEVVHHIDGNKQNNHPDNLELFASNGEHLAATLKGKCPKWSEEGKAALKRAVTTRRLHRQDLLLSRIQKELELDDRPRPKTVRLFLASLEKDRRLVCDKLETLSESQPLLSDDEIKRGKAYFAQTP